MSCPALLAGVGPLVCDRQEAHDPNATGGHTYTAAWLSDEHDRADSAANDG